MAYEFKSIADVEVVEKPSDTANVLIEENGIVMKAPKAAVGGAGAISIHYIFYNNGNDSVIVSEGAYDALENMRINKIPTLLFIICWDNDNDRIDRIKFDTQFTKDESGSYEDWDGSYHCYIHPDNTAEYYYDD